MIKPKYFEFQNSQIQDANATNQFKEAKNILEGDWDFSFPLGLREALLTLYF